MSQDAPPPRYWKATFAILGAAIALNLMSDTIADPDLWGHVLFGGLTRQLGNVPTVDPYSYTGDQAWINHEWFSEVIFSALYDLGGPTALVALKLGIALVLVGLVLWRNSRSELSTLRATAAGLFTLSPLIFFYGPVRPHLFTFLFFALTLLLLERAASDRRWLLGVAGLMVAWPNFHGGFLAGFGVLGIWIAADLTVETVRWWTRRRGPPLDIVGMSLLALGAAVAASMLNPYGFELLEFLLRTATVERPFITEWQAIEIQSRFGLLYLAVCAFGLATLYRSNEKIDPRRFAVFVTILLLPLTAIRHITLFAIGMSILLRPHIASAWASDRQSRSSAGSASVTFYRVTAGLGILVALLTTHRTFANTGCVTLSFDYPVRATEVIEQSDVRGRLASFFTWGEYLIWHLGPDLQVGMDGRRETVYSDSIYESYLNFSGGTEDWAQFIEEVPPDLIIMPTGQPSVNLLDLHPGWSSVYSDSTATVFARPSSESGSLIAATPVPAVPVSGEGLCFPGP